MGAQPSQPVTIPEQEEIMRETGFSQASILRLYERFQALDKDEKGYLSKTDLLGIGELAVNPIGDRIIDAFFQDGSETTNFRTFAQVLAHFRPVEGAVGSDCVNSRLSKLKFAFQLYDQDKDGKISRMEMMQAVGHFTHVYHADEGKLLPSSARYTRGDARTRRRIWTVLRMMIGIQVTDEQLECITDRTIQEADKDGDDAISFEEFAKSMEKLNIEQKMSLRILK